LRPGQWLKNGFVLAPLLFSRQYRDGEQAVRALIAAACFCLLSSAIYIFNDLRDLEEDRRHPVKRHRPLARSAVSKGAAVGLMGAAIGAGLGLAGARLGGWFVLLGLGFVALNAAYTLLLKHLVIVDVLAIAAGFVLRIWAGSVAIDVLPSHWLVLCTVMISLFLGFTKRRAELAVSGGEHTRLVLRDYSVGFLDQAIAMMTGVTILCYVLYTVDAQTVAMFGSHNLLLTVPFVLYGLFRYLHIAYHQQGGEDPTALAFRDGPLIVGVVLWALTALAVIQYGRDWRVFYGG
jgi:4-hydroxybenzoate polyprenyltransferase